ncbi:hypothetical protein ACFELO_05210 [Oceanicaulis sp. LC35]|uniref:hypothetical protein n=1 Tax=Oceanicaulis sp. LC35 TaxID=3349635 RepID=UPI003F8638B5
MPVIWTECLEGSGVWRAVYDCPTFGEVNALAIRLGELELAVLSPPPDPEGVYLEALSHLGRVTALIAPNAAHTSGLASWKQRCPDAGIYAADAVTAKVAKACGETVQPVSRMICPEGVMIYAAPGVTSGSLFMISSRGGKIVAYLDELVVCMRDWPRNWLSKALYFLTGTHPGLTLNYLFLHWFGKDKLALLTDAEKIAQRADMICGAHGMTVEDIEDLSGVHSMIRLERELRDHGR